MFGENKIFMCDCGEKFWIETVWNGVKYIIKFLDKNGREAIHCPGCGDYLLSLYINKKDNVKNKT